MLHRDFLVGMTSYINPDEIKHVVEIGGSYQFMGTAALGAGMDLAAQDYATDYGLWKRLNPANLITDSTTYAALSVLSATQKKLTGKDVQINIFEIKRPELDAQLVGESIARQLEARISFRRAVKTAVASSMRMGADGIKVMVAGRLSINVFMF